MSNNEEDKNLIAYCGLYCGDCFAHKERLRIFQETSEKN